MKHEDCLFQIESVIIMLIERIASLEACVTGRNTEHQDTTLSDLNTKTVLRPSTIEDDQKTKKKRK